MKIDTTSRLRLLIYLALAALAYLTPCRAYEVDTHKFLTGIAFDRSVLGASDKALLIDLGLVEKATDLSPLFPSEYSPDLSSVNLAGDNLSIRNLVRYGSEYEDDISLFKTIRVKNHFYDPQQDGIALTGTAVSPCIPPITLNGPPGNWPSPDWALEDINNNIPKQRYSYNDALGWFRNALTAQSASERIRNWGRTFQSLGHVVHHIQDMAQPQHTRNDFHLPCSGSAAFYESYTSRVQGKGGLPVAGYRNLDLSSDQFTRARRFWDFDGRGLAEFSSENFVSDGTNFTGNALVIQSDENHALPNGALAVASGPEDIQSIPCDPTIFLCVPSYLFGEITFIQNSVIDSVTGETLLNPRASSYGLFSYDLQTRGISYDFTLNRFNYDEAHKKLLPRAVSYSAGLIDYFFRGRISVELTNNDDSIEIKNVSNGNFAFKAGGTFEVYYETDTGDRKPVTNLSNLGLGGNLPVNGTHTITGLDEALESITDMSSEPRVYIVFDGDIGNERGIATANVEVIEWNAVVVYLINRHPDVFYVGIEFIGGVPQVNAHPVQLSIKIEGLEHAFEADIVLDAGTTTRLLGGQGSYNGRYRFLIANNMNYDPNYRAIVGAYNMGHDSPSASLPEFGSVPIIIGLTRASVRYR